MLGLNSNQEISNTTDTTIDWTNEITDRENNFDTSNERFTAPIAGDYLVCVNIQYTDTINQLHSGVHKNGGDIATNYDAWCNHGDGTRGHSRSFVVNLAVNDYLTIHTYHNNGASRYIEGNRCKATIKFLG